MKGERSWIIDWIDGDRDVVHGCDINMLCKHETRHLVGHKSTPTESKYRNC